MNYLIYITFGVLPSIIWLLFYLRKDVHPEPKLQVLKIFFYGMLIALPAVFLERGLFEEFKKIPLSPFFRTLLNTFVGVALIEEVLKYLVVKEKVLNDPEFDEPIDAILYMMIAALGFAASENILILFQLRSFLFSQALSVLALRFLGATFLHALSSGTVGFWLALSFLDHRREKLRLPILGLGMATLLHGLFNFSIIKGGAWSLISVLILMGLAIFVSLGFKKLKKMKSICKIS